MMIGMHFDERGGHTLDTCHGDEEGMMIYCISLMREICLVEEMR